MSIPLTLGLIIFMIMLFIEGVTRLNRQNEEENDDDSSNSKNSLIRRSEISQNNYIPKQDEIRRRTLQTTTEQVNSVTRRYITCL